MSEQQAAPLWAGHGIEPASLAALRELCARTPGLERLWVFGSRAMGTHRARSDIDLAADAPGWTPTDALKFSDALKALPIVYPVDSVWWQSGLGEPFREQIAKHRQVLWAPVAQRLRVESRAGAIELKPFQETVLARLADYLAEMQPLAEQSAKNAAVLRVMEGMDDALQALCFYAGANSIFYGDRLLTAGNPAVEADRTLLKRLDLKAQGLPQAALAGVKGV